MTSTPLSPARQTTLCIQRVLLSLISLLLYAAPARAESVSTEYHNPFAVQLVSYIDVHHFHAGSPFYVKAVHDWSALGCSFRTGQILEGKVALASPRAKKSGPSQLAISFEKTPCLYNKVSIDLVVAAAFFDASANIPSSPFPIMRTTASSSAGVSSAQRSFVVQGMELAAMGKGLERPSLKPGDVRGIKGVSLRVGEGPGRTSILESRAQDVWIDKEAVLLLVPAAIAFLTTTAPNVEINLSHGSAPAIELGEPHNSEPAALNIPASAPVPPAPPREFLPCEPPVCSVDLPAAAPENLGKASQSIALRPLGYAPRPQKEIGELEHDDAMAWLGSHQLIVAFNPHKLIARDPATAWADTLRRVHAVVLDVNTRKVVSTADWSLSDRQPYLWQLSANRVLVHVENELRVLNEDMKVEQRIALDGPLSFVRISPNGELVAYAVTHERHSPELHTKLREALDSDPDEDVSIRILDKEFHTIAEATSTRQIMPPILLNEGQVRMLAAPDAKYRLEMIPWQGQPKTIARFTSGCLPSVSSFAPDLLFVSTCSPQSGAHEYRILRPSGAVVLHGKSDPRNLGQSVLGAEQKFAVKVLHANRAIPEGSAFHGADIDFAEVRIYRAHDGRVLNAIQIGSPPPSSGAFALSSDGSQLAVFSNTAVNLYSVP